MKDNASYGFTQATSYLYSYVKIGSSNNKWLMYLIQMYCSKCQFKKEKLKYEIPFWKELNGKFTLQYYYIPGVLLCFLDDHSSTVGLQESLSRVYSILLLCNVYGYINSTYCAIIKRVLVTDTLKVARFRQCIFK